MRALSRRVAWIIIFAACLANAQVSATIDIDTTHSTSLNPNFSGFNDEVVFPAEYFDYRLNNLTSQLSPGWVRYPSGIFSDAFNWQTGLIVPSWAGQFQGTSIATLLAQSVGWVGGKGGGSFVDAANRADFLGAKLIVCVNGFTDTPQSAGQMAAFAKANHIPVAVWELSNEPYFFKDSFSSGADYVTKMKPYRDAIKAADPNATVAIFFDDAGDAVANPPWNQSIASYPNPYWDAVTYHHYPPESSGPFSQWMADENAVLASKTSAYVTGYLAPLNPPGMKFLISEFLPSSDGLGSGTSVTDGTLYGAVYAAEYMMRMSAVPSMLYVGMHALTGMRGVYATQTHFTDVQDAYSRGTTVNTLSLNFGFYTVAQPMGLAVVNGVLRNSSAVNATTVTGGATVAAAGLGQIPALYAQAYTSTTGQQSLLITNKSAIAQQVTIRFNGTTIPGTLPTTSIYGADPTAVNTPTAPFTVSPLKGTSGNPVTVPPYCVMRVDLSPPASLSVVNNASYAAGAIAPQEFVSLFAPGIANTTLTAASLPLPQSLGSTTVQIADSSGNTALAQLFSVSPNQVNILLPSGLAAGPAKIIVFQGITNIYTGSATIASSSPGLYSMNSDGAGVAAADAFRATASGSHIFETLFTCNSPALRSCLPAPLSFVSEADSLYVELYGTGIRGASSVQAFVAGQNVQVLYAGPVAAYAGLDQVDVAIPRSLSGAGDVRVYLVADGVASNAVVLNLQ